MAQTDFGADEFRARREKLIEAIGDQSIDVLQADADSPAMGSFRQGNEFYYLCGMFEFRGHLSHCVGMCVHDGGGHWRKPLEPASSSPWTRRCACPRSASTSASRTRWS